MKNITNIVTDSHEHQMAPYQHGKKERYSEAYSTRSADRKTTTKSIKHFNVIEIAFHDLSIEANTVRALVDWCFL